MFELREKAGKIRSFLVDSNLETVRQARVAVEQLAPALRTQGQEARLGSAAEELAGLLRSPELMERVKEAARLAESVNSSYQEYYRELHNERFQRYRKAMDEIRGMSDFLELDEAAQQTVLQPLLRRAVEEVDLPAFEPVARNTGATLGELRADIEALPGLQSDAIRRMQEILAKAAGEKVKVQRVKLAGFFTGPKDPEKTEKENLDAALDRLREHVYALLEEGVKIIWE